MIAEVYVKESELYDIAQKVFAGIRLDREDGVRLYESYDLLTIGYLANCVREKLQTMTRL